MSPGSVNSPLYNPNSELYKTPNNPYSPIIEYEEDIHKSINKQPLSPYSPGSPVVYTPNDSVYAKSPYIQPGAGSRSYNVSSNPDSSQSPTNTYSPTNVPQYGQISSYSSNNTPRYKSTTSPGYISQNNNNQGNYSPSTSMYNKNSVSPDYTNSNVRGSSHYSGGSSPRIHDSGGSPGQYSPKSPAYNNAKSPSYNMKIGKHNILI